MKISLLCLILLLAGCSKQSSEPASDESIAQPSVAQERQEVSEKPSEENGIEQILAVNNLPEVIELIKPKMTDEFDAFPAVAGVLAFWIENKSIKIGDIKQLESTSRGKILKDSFSERGKRLCVTGSIVEINVDRSAGFAAYHVGLVTNYVDATRMLAVGSTGDLVEKSNATFCGVVIGKVSYSNAAGGTTHAPYLVGMFDLPENK